LALPLIALQYHEVRLCFEFENIQKLIVWQGYIDQNGKSWGPDYRHLCMKEASLLVDYIYLDSVERRRFAQVGHEYLIEQVQFTGDETMTGNPNTSNINYKSKLGFNHPTKELIWVVKNSVFCGDDRSAGSNGGSGAGHPFLAYSNEDDKWETCALQEAANNIAVGMLALNKADMIPPSNGNPNCPEDEVSSHALNQPAIALDVMTRKNPDHSIRFNIFVHRPSPNFYLNIQKYPVLSGTPSPHGSTGFNFADYINEVQVNVNLEQCCFTATVISQCLTVNEISIPLDWGSSPNCLVDKRFNTCNGVNPYDVYIIQHFNYGLRLDGKGGPIVKAGLQLNGQDRFDCRTGGYFNYVQPWAHHTHTPPDGVYVYSFALHPEQHQPTGTANLSRIDSTVLYLCLEDCLRNRFGVKNRLSIDLCNAKLFVFAFSYNVLRIMSGMGGLAYSN